MAYIIFVQPAVLSVDLAGKPAGLDFGAVLLATWDDYSEGIPAFLTVVGIPLSYSIADGLALGFISYPLLKLLSGQARRVGVMSYVMAALLAAYFVLVRSRLG